MKKVLLLAAGSGTRLAPYTKDLPKGMLPVDGVPLLERQIALYRRHGFTEIGIVTGYHAEAIQFPGVTTFHNPDFATTNMVYSMQLAREFMRGGCVVSYSDLLLGSHVIEHVKAAQSELGVVVDARWREYWTERFGHAEDDLESLEVSGTRIVSLGAKVTSSQGLEYRYVGVNRFSAKAVETLLTHFDLKAKSQAAWSPSGKPFALGYMTDLLNELSQGGFPVEATIVQGGWMEFDTREDYEATQVPGPLNARLAALLRDAG